ncbi:raffinose/stachyose/melibiose transport system permease protein [Herbinix hemicellulosilytica]|uniref:Putative membrane protein n=1 Tax=Herbinix hemicellulosilytica TaxID=1564487 RepID=A0A0H5SI40_HERHM|nr:sugar ABC transporter permease [Herbinix hemicellulosilytica]RBP60789.1 raffinose/stachyose/melibiose transport system permease protein [Herbinix hemicellulosilytica]CRZ34476.1 putative membrane protein [Herbinix hemicellulosilytica]HPU64171.1 sugar ABC transporter permease [Mobilitalea sp.]
MKSKTNWFKKDSTQAVLMLSPMLIGFVLFTYFPIIYILRYAFYDSNGIKDTFIGFENFVRVFTRDKTYWNSLLNTIILSFGKLAVEIPLALLLAVLLNKGRKGTGFFRTVLFMPTVISAAIAGLIYSLMFASFNGIVNGMLQNIGLIERPISWFSYKGSAMFVIGLASVWNNFGINMVFFLMALQSVPQELYECADLDGVNPVQRFFKITLPMIGPTFQVVLLNAIVGSLKMSDLILSTTNGQPGGKTEVVMTYVFKYFFGYDGRTIEVGYASCMALVTAVVLAMISLIYMKSSKKLGNSY